MAGNYRPKSAGKYRPKMSSEDRAKQFMPFSALKGYEEALRQAEALSENKFNNLIVRDKETFEDDPDFNSEQ